MSIFQCPGAVRIKEPIYYDSTFHELIKSKIFKVELGIVYSIGDTLCFDWKYYVVIETDSGATLEKYDWNSVPPFFKLFK